MLKNRNLLMYILCIVFILTGCSQNSEYAKAMEESKNLTLPIYTKKESEKYRDKAMNFQDKNRQGYKTDRIAVSDISSIGGILCIDGQVLISDTKKDCLILMDNEGNVLREIGKMGSGPLEFQNPAKMALYQNQIYLIDKGNSRVQILNKDLTFADEIPIMVADEKDPNLKYEYIAVNEKGIYLCPVSMIYSEIHLYADKSGKYKKIGHNFYGPLAENGEKVYAINQYIKVYEKREDSMQLVSMGPNYFFELSDESGEILKKTEISPGLTISDFLFEGNEMYAVSSSYMSVLVFDKMGNYKETLARVEEDGSTAYLAKDSEGCFWIGFENGHLYIARPQK